MSDTTHCYVYRSQRKDGLYLFVLEEDVFDSIPESVMQYVGKLDKAMELDLHPERKLARGNAAEVIAKLKEQGFHIQVPPQDEKLPLAQ